MSEPALHVIPLPGQFVQVQLGALKEIVNHHQEDGGVVQFDAAQLERIDGAAVQFLLAVAKVQQNADLEVLVVNAHDIVCNALIDMGVNELVITSSAPDSKVA